MISSQSVAGSNCILATAMLKFEYRLNERDLLEACDAHQRSQRVSYLLRWLASVITLLLAAVIPMNFSVGNRVNDVVFVSVYVLMAILINPEVKINFFQHWMVHRAWQQNANLHDPIAVEVTEAGLTLTTPNASAQTNWRGFIRCLETPHLFLMYQSRQLFNIIPKRAFRDVNDVNEFRSLLRISVPEKFR